MHKLDIKEIKKRILVVHDNNVTIEWDLYKNVHSKAIFKDVEFGEWTAKIYSVLNGRGHPKRKNAETSKRCRIPIDVVKKKIQDAYGDVLKIKEDTYKGTSVNATFTHSIYGEWIIQPRHVLTGIGHPKDGSLKAQETRLKKYGVRFTHQNKDIALKSARSSNNCYIKFHWKTNEELICKGSYEAKVVDYLNKNQINFLWQPKTFIMPNDKTYLPDLYLISENKWVEIKGWMRKDAQEKWDWFKTINPTAELWNKEKLKEMRIL